MSKVYDPDDTGEFVEAKLRRSFEFVVTQIQRKRGLPSDTGLSAEVEVRLLAYQRNPSPSNLDAARLEFEKQLKGLHKVDG